MIRGSSSKLVINSTNILIDSCLLAGRSGSGITLMVSEFSPTARLPNTLSQLDRQEGYTLGLTPTIGVVRSKAALQVYLISTSAMSMATLYLSHALLRVQQSPVAISIYLNSQALYIIIKSTALFTLTPLRISPLDPLRLFLKLALGLPTLILMITRLT